MVLVQKWPFFQLVFQAIQARKMSFTIFWNKKRPMQAIKRRSSRSGKIDVFPQGVWTKNVHFSTLLFSGNIGTENVFYRILEQKKTPFKAIKKRSSKSQKTDIFSKGLTHGFGQKITIFPTFFFRQYRPGKCLLQYSKTKRRLSRL